MDQQELIPIHVWLAGRSYRIRIRAEEEAAVRRAVKAADDQISELRRHYAGKDDQDFVAMCLLMYAADYATDPLQHPDLRRQLDALNARLDAALDEPEA